MTKFARTYGSALFDLAKEEGIDSRILQDLVMISDAIDQIPGYLRLLQSPALGSEERSALIDEAWKDSVHAYSLNFLKMLCDKEKAGEFSECADEFRQLFNREHGIVPAKLTSAVPLSDDITDRLIAVLEKKTGKKIELSVETDESIIGGLRLDIDGMRYDGTVSGHLEEIRKLLK